MKTDLRTKRGIIRVNMENFVYEFQFRRKFLRKKNAETFEVTFKKILMLK